MRVLCAPTPEISCFGCCPPIRPSHYDPLDYPGSLRREFVENRRDLLCKGPRYRPIVGYHCWALGFLDKEGHRVGCLLHPAQNEGRDLRFLIDYGDKCRRESCLPARMFALLPEKGQCFWLSLIEGLSTFYFSSPRSNPLFHLMLWGAHVLELLRLQAERLHWSVTELIWRQAFLMSPSWNPRGHAYLFRLALECLGEREYTDGNPERFCRSLWPLVRSLSESVLPYSSSHEESYVHQLSLDCDFLDLLRIGLNRRKLSRQQASTFKERVDDLARQLSPKEF